MNGNSVFLSVDTGSGGSWSQGVNLLIFSNAQNPSTIVGVKIWKETDVEPPYSPIAFQYYLTGLSNGWYLVKLLTQSNEELFLARFQMDTSKAPFKYELQRVAVYGYVRAQIDTTSGAPDPNTYQISLDGINYLATTPESNNLHYVIKNFGEIPAWIRFYGKQNTTEYQAFDYFNWGFVSGPPDLETPDPVPPPDVDPVPETNLTLFGPIYFNRNPITFGASAPVGWNGYLNPRVIDDVRIGVDSVLKIHLPPDSLGNVNFEVSEAFTDLLIANPPDPTEVIVKMVELTDRIKSFTHNTGFVKEEELEPASYTASGSNKVMLGGLSKYAFKSFNFFSEILPTKRMFLTWAPLVKQVDRTQPDFLTYFNYNSYNTKLYINFHITFDDGTTERSVSPTFFNSTGGKLYQFNVGPANSEVLTFFPAKTAISYRVYLTNQNSKLVSDFRTFEIDPISLPNKKFIMFLNSLGAYEVHRFSGQSEQAATISKSIVKKLLQLNYASYTDEAEVTNALLQNSTNYSSGFLTTREWFDHFKELVLSNKVFDITDRKRKSIIIDPGTFDFNKDQDYNRFVRFTALDSFLDRNYTPSWLE